MQALFKKYFFLVNLLFIGVSAYLLARAGNIFVGHFLTPALPEAVANAPTKPTVRDRPSESRAFDSATERNIFAAKREQLVPVEQGEEVEEKTEVDLSAEAVPTSLNIKLVGTTVFIPAEWSLASIEDLSAKEVGIYSINACARGAVAPSPAASEGDDDDDDDEGGRRTALRDEPPKGAVRSVALPTPCNRLLDTATILSIEVDRVVFLNEQSGRKEYVDFYGEPKPGAKVAAAPKPAKKEAGGPTGQGIKKISENSYEIEQGEIDATLSNLNSIATQARIVPSFKDGQANGFKLFSIRPGSLYSKIGIKNGDVVQRINGYEITSPDKALEIYSKLKDSKSITVDLQRRGKPQTLDYRIVP